MLKIYVFRHFLKKVKKIFGYVKNCHYLCTRYPENNLIYR